MKQKITNIILGVIIGSIITATGFIIYIKGNDLHPRPKGMPSQMAQGMSGQNSTAPTGQKGDTNSGTTTQQAQTTANNSSTTEKTTSTTNNN